MFTTTILAFLTAFVVTPAAGYLARRLNVVDRPDGHRKVHDRVIPLGGGIAVLLGIIAALGLSLRLASALAGAPDWTFWGSLLAAAFLIAAVGLIDDRFGLRGRQKMAGQLLAAGVLVAGGLCIEHVRLFSWNIELGLLAIPFSLFWLLGAINALNLIDGLDGLAASVGIVLSLALAGMAFLGGRELEALAAMAVAGSLAGFLPHNFPRARIFLGDAGSMLIGLMLGALAIRSSLKGPATVALAAPTAVWAIPIFDVGMAIVRRKLTGQSLYMTDRGHLHYHLLQRGFSSRKTVCCIGLLCAATAAGALASVAWNNEALAVGAAAAVAGTCILTRLFGHTECRLLARRLRGFAASLVLPRRRRAPQGCESTTHLQGTQQWDDLWQSLIEFAERFDLSSVELNISMPAAHEAYHASWNRRDDADSRTLWHTEIPLNAYETTVGRLRISGACHNGSACLHVGDLLSGLKAVESSLADLVAADVAGPHTLKGAGDVENARQREGRCADVVAGTWEAQAVSAGIAPGYARANPLSRSERGTRANE